MSTHRKMEWTLFLLGSAGALFSGYLSTQKFFFEKCVLAEPCTSFLGYPSCYFGFLLFLAITLFSALHLAHFMDGKKANEVVLVVSGIGIVFAGYFTIGELPIMLREGIGAYTLGLPSCSYGLILFAFVFVFSRKLKKDFVTR